MNHKKKGSKGERKARKLLEALGYFVIRAAGSHGAADLVAISQTELKVIQVKCGQARCSPAEREALQMLPLPIGISSREVWTFKPFARSPLVVKL